MYCIDSLGQTKRVIHIGFKNRDWEDLAQDSEGRFYIGAFGNNGNKRKDLKVLIIPPPDSISDRVVLPETIEFSYEDQKEFPPDRSVMNYDAEAMVVKGDYIYIFSKNRAVPFDGTTNMYRLPRQPGKYVAKKMGSTITANGPRMENWVTSASISPDGTKLALLTQSKLYLFVDFEGDDFFGGSKVEFLLNDFTQKEGVAFSDNNTLYIVDERTDNFFGGKMYRYKLNK